MTAPTPTAPEGPPGLDGADDERRRVQRLLRFVAMFVAWPSLSIGLAFLVFTDPATHWLHIGGLLPLGVAALVLFARAPALAARWMAAEDRRSPSRKS